ncbi:MAG: LCP family protein [Erysipelotrichaceae bacterium]|nr:LCP family protein [Erysipelotrichaceae bacterium]
MKKKNDNKGRVIKVLNIIFVFICHVMAVLLFLNLKDYYHLNPTIFLSAFGILACLLLIVDILLLESHISNGKVLRFFIIVVSLLLLGVTSAGVGAAYYLKNSIKGAVNSDPVQYETIKGAVVVYNNKYSDLKQLNGKTLGLIESSDSSSYSYIGKEVLEQEGINVNYKSYNDTTSLIVALASEEVDAIIASDTYKVSLQIDEALKKYADSVSDIYTFSKEVEMKNNVSSSMDITNTPFNILLIGFAPNSDYSGLADAILLATVNPNTHEVSIISIPRDSYVPIACANNSKDKLTHARGYSRGCLVDSVANLFGQDINFYAEINFKGLVDVVDAVGGIDVYNPIAFTGQNSDLVRGAYIVDVPQGDVHLNGEQALAFARERHAFENGDFDRNKNQMQVIQQLLIKIMKKADMSMIINLLDIAGENFTTNLSVNQITKFFNYVSSAKSDVEVNSNLGYFQIITNQLLGYGSMSYNYSLELPLYVAPVYQESLSWAKNYISKIKADNISTKINNQFTFAYTDTYYDPASPTTFTEERVHETMPDFVPTLTSMTLKQVIDWCNKVGLPLNIEYVTEGDPGYVPNSEGKVLSQSYPYGKLVSVIDSITIRAIPYANEEDLVPDFVGSSLASVNQWAEANGYTVDVTYVETLDYSYNYLVSSQDLVAGTSKYAQNAISVVVYQYTAQPVPSSALSSLAGGIGSWTRGDISSWANSYLVLGYYNEGSSVATEDPNLDGKLASYYFSSGASSPLENDTLIYSMYSYTAPEPDPQPDPQPEPGEGE